MTLLYRAVKSEELQDITETSRLRNVGWHESKFFSGTPEGASSYAQQAFYAYDDAEVEIKIESLAVEGKLWRPEQAKETDGCQRAGLTDLPS